MLRCLWQDGILDIKGGGFAVGNSPTAAQLPVSSNRPPQDAARKTREFYEAEADKMKEKIQQLGTTALDREAGASGNAPRSLRDFENEADKLKEAFSKHDVHLPGGSGITPSESAKAAKSAAKEARLFFEKEADKLKERVQAQRQVHFLACYLHHCSI